MSEYNCCNLPNPNCTYCPQRPLKWEHIWDAPDGTYKGRCKNCGFTTIFHDGHDSQYKFCPQCGQAK